MLSQRLVCLVVLVPCGHSAWWTLDRDRATNERAHCRISRTILEITEGIQGRLLVVRVLHRGKYMYEYV